MSSAPTHPDSFKCRKTLTVGAKTYEYFSLPDAERNGLAGIASLPLSLKVLLENLLRFEDGRSVKADDIRAVAEWLKTKTSTREIAYRPARVLMQDFTGVPAVVDLAAMRDAMRHLNGDPGQDQSAGSRRPRHRPFRPGGFLRLGRRVQEERRDRIRAQQGALRVPALGGRRVQQFPRGAARAPASVTRSTSNTWRRPCGPRTAGPRKPIPTRASAPTATPPWSTRWACSAGAWAASKRKPPCWDSRSPW